MTQIYIYDTTLRDGSQGEGVSFSLEDKLNVARRLDEIGVPFIEGGWPGSNDKDRDFFRAIRDVPLRQAQIAAFGSTRRAGAQCEADSQIAALLEAETPVVTIVGKSWDLHVHHVLETTLDENLAMIGESVRYLPRAGPPRLLRRRALLRRLQGQPGIRPGDHRRGRGRGRRVRHPVRDERRRAAVGGRGDRPQGVCLPDRARGRARGRCAGADRDSHARRRRRRHRERAGRGARGCDAGAGYGQRLRRAGGQLQPLHRDPRSPAQDGLPLPG